MRGPGCSTRLCLFSTKGDVLDALFYEEGNLY
jgi:hypothetical protein